MLTLLKKVSIAVSTKEPRALDIQRNDFMTYILRYNDEKGMSIPEIEATFRVSVVAGSETTGTALSGIMGHLLQSPNVMDNVTK
jgi:cytochrome P450